MSATLPLAIDLHPEAQERRPGQFRVNYGLRRNSIPTTLLQESWTGHEDPCLCHSSADTSQGVAIPLISIVMPTFNRAAFLPRSLSSALGQTFTDWELIIVDDGGEDRTPEVVSPYLADPRIHYVWQSHRGVGQTRNAGIARASGRYITFLDSDDAYRPTHLESRVEILARRPELDLVQGGVEVIGDIYTIDFDDPTRRISLYDCVTGATMFGKREVFEALGGFRPLMNYEDTDFWRRAQAQFVTESLKAPQTYEYYRHSESITRTATHEQWQEARQQLEPPAE